MEIKGVGKQKIEYPKIKEISDNKLKTCIPNKWTKLGITALAFEFIMKDKVSATDTQVLAGNIAVVETVSVTSYINKGITLGTIIMFIISLIGLIVAKHKIKKDNQNEKIKKIKNIFKLLLIISIIIFVIWQIIYAFL